MSSAPEMRRADRSMSQDATLKSLQEGYCGRLTTIGPDDYPYCVPLLYVCMAEELYVHGTNARGHLRTNLEFNPRVCFEVDFPGEVFPYGRFECDMSVSYRSVVAFGQATIIRDTTTKQRFCEALLAKYGGSDMGRPKGFFPRLNLISVYAIAIERITGKEQILPPLSERWPAMDRTKTPLARP